MLKKAIIIIALIQNSAFALEITNLKPTECVGKICQSANVTFSNVITIYDVKYVKTEDNSHLIMPLTSGRAKNQYSNVRIESKTLHDKLIDAFQNRKIEKKDILPIDVRVLSARKLLSDFRIANVNILFDGELLVTFGLLRLTTINYRTKTPTISEFVSIPKNFKFQSPIFENKIKKLIKREGLRVSKKTK